MQEPADRAERAWLEDYEHRFKDQLKANYEDPRIRGLVQFRCNNWMDLAQAVAGGFGASGKDIVRQARFRSATEVAGEIKRLHGTDVQAIYRYYRKFLPWQEPIWDMSLEDLPHKMILRTKCLVGECWQKKIAREKDCEELCWIFCSWDEEVAKRVNPKIKCEVKKWIAHGSPYCELVWTTQDS